MKHIMLSLLFSGIILGNISAISTNAVESQDFEFREENGILYIEDYLNKTSSEITIPAQFNGMPVALGEYQFEDCPNVSAFHVEGSSNLFTALEGVLFTESGNTLFRYPTAKEGAYEVPEGVNTILAYAFSNNNALTELTLPESVATIGVCAFENCTTLQRINGTVPAESSSAFSGCQSLTELQISGEAKLFNFGFRELPSLRSIVMQTKRNMFGSTIVTDMSSLETLFFPSGCDVLEEKSTPLRVSVTNCPKLSELRLPENADEVNVGDCESLQTLIVPSSSKDITIQTCPELSLVVNHSDKYYFIDQMDENKKSNLTVIGQPEGRVHSLCEENHLKFRCFGDVTYNNSIELMDVISLNKNLLGINSLDKETIFAADVNADGSLDSSDSLLILRYIVHLEDKLG